MNLAYDRFRLHAYVDGELTPDEIADFERLLAQDPEAMAEVAALRAQKNALHDRYDPLLTKEPDPRLANLQRSRPLPFGSASRGLPRWALAATLLVAAGVGLGAGWVARGASDESSALASREAALPAKATTESRLQAFVQTATVSHAIFVPEVRHPVEVPGAEETHLVAWLSKRLDAPLVVPRLADAGWDLLGGRLLPEESGPVAQFMYQDAEGRRLTLAVSKSVIGAADKATKSAGGPSAAAMAQSAFRIADENGSTVFYWLDGDYAYALTGKLKRNEMTALASRVYRQLDRMAK